MVTLRTVVVIALLFSSLVSRLSPVRAEDNAREIAQRIDGARKACFSILVEGHLAGSGCCIDPKGTGLTAAHLLGVPKGEVEVLLGDGTRLPARIIAVDLTGDLALLSLPRREQPYPFLPVATGAAAVTQPVFLVGSPIFRRGLVMRGNVASEGPRYEFTGDHYILGFHITGAGPPGSSGGPWLNTMGEVVGVQTSSMTVDKVPQGIAISAPLAEIHRLLATRRNPATPSLGTAVEELWGQEPKFIEQVAKGTTGVVLRQVREDGPAHRAGLNEWDIVTHFDGEGVQTIDAFVGKVLAKKPGDVVTLKAVDEHGENPREVQVPVARLGIEWDKAVEEPKKAEEEKSREEDVEE